MGAAMAGVGVGVVGSMLSNIGGLMKGDPPAYKPVDLSESASTAATINASNLPANEATASNVNAFNQSQVLKMLNTAIPDYQKISGQMTSSIESELSGQLPQDVIDQITNQTAAFGVSSGTSGSQFAGYKGLRDLGLNSLQMVQQGMSSADAWLKTASSLTKAPTMNVASMFVNPMQVQEAQTQQNQLIYGSNMTQWDAPNALQITGASMSGAGGMMTGMGSGGGGGVSGMLGGGGSGSMPASQNFSGIESGSDYGSGWMNNWG